MWKDRGILKRVEDPELKCKSCGNDGAVLAPLVTELPHVSNRVGNEIVGRIEKREEFIMQLCQKCLHEMVQDLEESGDYFEW
jgi:hypothetical protein